MTNWRLNSDQLEYIISGVIEDICMRNQFKLSYSYVCELSYNTNIAILGRIAISWVIIHLGLKEALRLLENSPNIYWN